MLNCCASQFKHATLLFRIPSKLAITTGVAIPTESHSSLLELWRDLEVKSNDVGAKVRVFHACSGKSCVPKLPHHTTLYNNLKTVGFLQCLVMWSWATLKQSTIDGVAQ